MNDPKQPGVSSKPAALSDSHLNGQNVEFLEGLYEQFRQDPNSVDEAWKTYFSSIENNDSIPSIPTVSTSGVTPAQSEKQAAVARLVAAYRWNGHKVAKVDPISQMQRESAPELDLKYYGLSDADMNTEFDVGTLNANKKRMPLKDIFDLLEKSYCASIGSEFSHLSVGEEKHWLRKKLEQRVVTENFNTNEKKDILNLLTAAEGIERYLHTKYVGQKRFSLEGGECLIPMLDELVQRGGASGVKEFVIGMAHRGRLNVLVNILGKSPKNLFAEFEGKYDVEELSKSGDVKYHQGFSSDVNTPGGIVHLSLAFNPSHLEIVSPVVVGSVKARQQRRSDKTGDTVLPIAIHGDAAFAGQGVVMETFNMSACRGYGTGGTVHVVVNNQIGFTTSHPQDARSTPYCTDVAKMVGAPIFHVNGDDPEAVIFVTQLALDFRQKYNKDVVIDLICYRRHGHNEADEPAVTQPIMYKTIKALPTTRRLYAEKLIQENVITTENEKQMMSEYRASLEEGNIVIEDFVHDHQGDHTVDWSPYLDTQWTDNSKTNASSKRLKFLADKMLTLPKDFELHPRAKKIMDDRRKMADGKMNLDWGMAENLAYATLLDDGFAVRLSGQDCGRGTFFHRHATLHNTKNRDVHIPLRHLSDKQPNFLVINSLLSEEAVLAFEYGYATADPKTLVIWEAQFGDFANGAQVVMDQFISSGEEKWGRLCGLVMFLPHGYEGQGPEHSSARLERYLQLCAQHNMQVCMPSTPGQMFHMLRRQMLRPYRKPLVVMTPKSLLRHKLSVSSLDELQKGHFQNVITEIDDIKPKSVKRLVLCSGKVYFDILEERRKRKMEDVAIVRIEQLYPFPREEVIAEIKKYATAKEVVWCQEEPLNQGAWYQIKHHIRACINEGQKVIYAGRESTASPAAGYLAVHNEQQSQLVDAALSPLDKNKTYIVEQRYVN